MRRDHWKLVNDSLDPETQFTEIYRNVVMYEFPWDMNQALSFALFRTYAVPGIGRLLDQTGEFTGAVQKRYDDTAILLEQPFRLGFDHPQGRAAVRRINQMHRAYDIPDHEFRYVLSTFVVVPKRWLDDYGKRPLTPTELRASVNYYRTLGRHMNIPDIPETYDDFARLMDDYEAEHFAFDEGARRVADATLQLMLTFHPRPAARGVEVFSRALMDPPLRAAFRYAAPHPLVERASRGALKVRGLALRAFPARTRAQTVQDLKWIRSYPDGYDVERMGTFPAGCPVPHPVDARADVGESGSSIPPAAT
ncbi:oxygenase MpaB family protein [Nocardioides sp. LS1]|uniref:oxygenase MpaB family protein n=1 Tax=Nocardioides sp. LS1 TaxID=1027620 RepID=UPI000F61A487|nr:oxygenase MpaB family protein [Nocardioides sp. LS1]GCD90972.1 peptidase [Nocardioides sp. LS1]